MPRAPNKLNEAKAEEARAVAASQRADPPGKYLGAAKTALELIEPMLYVAMFVYFAWRARSLLGTGRIQQGKLFVDLWLADATGFVVGPLVAAFVPGHWTTNLSYLVNNFFGVIISNYPTLNHIVDTDDGKGRATVTELSRIAKQDGWWEAVWRYEKVLRDPVHGGPHGLFWFDGFRPSIMFALMFGSICTLVAKGAGGLLKKVIP